ncbi:MAG TPA: hypothetical protein PL045_05800 [Chitinophagaceae bacterium]|nr:hypothetical protein [Chitinophagaceae bacterium]
MSRATVLMASFVASHTSAPSFYAAAQMGFSICLAAESASVYVCKTKSCI